MARAGAAASQALTTRMRRLHLSEVEIRVLLEQLEVAQGGKFRPWNTERSEALRSARAKLEGRRGRARPEVEPGFGSP